MPHETSVVVLIAAATEPTSFIRSVTHGRSLDQFFLDELAEIVSVSVISWLPADGEPDAAPGLSLSDRPASFVDRALKTIGAYSVAARLAEYPIGRLANSFSLTDQSRVFSRAVDANRDAQLIVRAADLVVAADMPAVRTAWKALHGGHVPKAVHGLQSAPPSLRGE